MSESVHRRRKLERLSVHTVYPTSRPRTSRMRRSSLMLQQPCSTQVGRHTQKSIQTPHLRHSESPRQSLIKALSSTQTRLRQESHPEFLRKWPLARLFISQSSVSMTHSAPLTVRNHVSLLMTCFERFSAQSSHQPSARAVTMPLSVLRTRTWTQITTVESSSMTHAMTYLRKVASRLYRSQRKTFLTNPLSLRQRSPKTYNRIIMYA